MRTDPTISAVCRAYHGFPHEPPPACTGCGCPCHHVPIPPNFRLMVEERRARREARRAVAPPPICHDHEGVS
jgi:hypothetical protein